MDRWAGALYGDPCRECGFAFSTGLDESLAYIDGISDRYSALLAGANGTERHSDLSWSVGSYVCHVGDNLRIWAERLAGLATELRAGQIVGTSALLAVRARTALGREGPVPFDGALCDPQPGVLAGHGQFHWADPDAPWRGGRWLMAHRESERSAAVEIRSGRPADAAMIVQAAAALAVARAADAGQRVFRS